MSVSAVLSAGGMKEKAKKMLNFQKRTRALLISVVVLVVVCVIVSAGFALNKTNSAGETVPRYTPQKWLDLVENEKLRGESREITLPEFPGVTFTWTADTDKVTDGEKELFQGMPIWNVYLADLTNDGKPEFCATISFGSGMIDERVLVYDYVTGKTYELSDRATYDYSLSLQDGKLMVTQRKHNSDQPLVSSELRLVNGDLYRFGESEPEADDPALSAKEKPTAPRSVPENAVGRAAQLRSIAIVSHKNPLS